MHKSLHTSAVLITYVDCIKQESLKVLNPNTTSTHVSQHPSTHRQDLLELLHGLLRARLLRVALQCLRNATRPQLQTEARSLLSLENRQGPGSFKRAPSAPASTAARRNSPAPPPSPFIPISLLYFEAKPGSDPHALAKPAATSAHLSAVAKLHEGAEVLDEGHEVIEGHVLLAHTVDKHVVFPLQFDRWQLQLATCAGEPIAKAIKVLLQGQGLGGLERVQEESKKSGEGEGGGKRWEGRGGWGEVGGSGDKRVICSGFRLGT